MTIKLSCVKTLDIVNASTSDESVQKVFFTSALANNQLEMGYDPK